MICFSVCSNFLVRATFLVNVDFLAITFAFATVVSASLVCSDVTSPILTFPHNSCAFSHKQIICAFINYNSIIFANYYHLHLGWNLWKAQSAQQSSFQPSVLL
ncbi:hypothetical protein VCHA54P500_70085 [Vibrio chagasii]|nr:hypothetical protein VCHA34P116_110085 [Vibrio chagasii]CAH6834723.1 hypothetical protein VCHA35O137_10100 [Vibrio chagasii]CAH6861746.1 hypothetical protein VCHA32P90_11024 [Vibrio chagasii]CAH6946418.1 hypothetical protein VCHA35O141_30138 [Vibrio chagasii]CAH6947058.1 hypothetical protein VCHA35O143_30103 [Vibrio chagasii]